MIVTQSETPNTVIQLRLTEMETREAILEHVKDIAEGRIWKRSGYASLQKYCERELGYSGSEARELLTQIGEILPAAKLSSLDPGIQFRIDTLKNWRRQKAKALETRAYQVISNKTLLELAERNPNTKTELLTIYGIGEKKCEAYGAEILAYLSLSATHNP